LEDFIVLDDDGNEHKGIIIIHREEYDADTYISKKMRERHFGRDDREADLDAIREEWAEGTWDGLDIEMPDGSIHSIGTVWVEDKIPLIYHLGQMRYSFRNDELYQTYFPPQIPLPKNAESLREEYERHWGEIDDDQAKGLIRCAGCDEPASYYDERNFCEACQGRKKEGLMDDEGNFTDDPSHPLYEYPKPKYAESSSSLQSFAAEVFEADRKIRRRTRWTWTKGMEGGFDHDDLPYYLNRYEYTPSGAYHISDLPEGYHLHLYKPRRRSKKWIAKVKSPQMDDWNLHTAKNKSALTPELLEWYNLTIAKPTKQEMTPIMQMLIDTGSASGEVKISRVVVPEVPKMKKMPDGTTQKVGVINYAKTQFYATQPNKRPTLLAEKKEDFPIGYDFAMSEGGYETLGVLEFMQGLAFIGEKAATTRSINRYNKDKEAWVKSYPAWFQNTVKNKITNLYIDFNDNKLLKKITESGDNIDIEINGVTVATLNRGEPYYRRRKPDGGNQTEYDLPNKPKISVMGTDYPPIFILNKEGNIEQPRPSTQRKIYQNSMVLQDDGTYKIDKVKFIMEITDRYKFENEEWLKKDMIMQRVNLESQSMRVNSIYQPIMKTMLRRFKKNDE